MATSLWEKFQSAVRYVQSNSGTYLGQAAVATMLQAPANQPPAVLFDTTVSNQQPLPAKPSSSTDGIDIEGQKSVNIYYRQAPGQTCSINVYVYDNDPSETSDQNRWWLLEALDLNQDEGVKTVSLEGGWTRLAVSLPSAPAGSVRVKILNYNHT